MNMRNSNGRSKRLPVGSSLYMVRLVCSTM